MAPTQLPVNQDPQDLASPAVRAVARLRLEPVGTLAHLPVLSKNNGCGWNLYHRTIFCAGCSRYAIVLFTVRIAFY